MRVAVVSHSLVADRQAIFWNHFALQKDITLLQIFPKQWRDLKREDGYKVRSYEMFSYLYGEDAREGLREFQPDLVYIQEEVYSMVTRQMVMWAKSLKSQPKVGVFVWDNLHKGEIYLSKLDGIDFIIAGNGEAAEIHGNFFTDILDPIILPQVGVDFDLFKPAPSSREYDLVFASRKERSKGYDIIERLPYKLKTTQGEPYSKLPIIYNSGKVHIVLAEDLPHWKEQFLPYANVEALACGLPCVVGDVTATRFWGKDCPGMRLVPSRDREKIIEAVASSLTDWSPNMAGREWAEQRFSLKAVSNALLKVFQANVAIQ